MPETEQLLLPSTTDWRSLVTTDDALPEPLVRELLIAGA
jgi:hypothetical protein